MIRHAAVAVAAFCLFPAALHAQVQSTVTAASAEVRSAPSIVNPVIGRAARGTALEITRDIGDWYKIAWPAARDGVGYVRRSDVSRAPRGTGTTGLTANGRPTEGERAGSRAASPSMSAEKRAVLSDLAIERQPSAVRAANLAAPSHVLGIGGLMDGRLPSPSF